MSQILLSLNSHNIFIGEKYHLIRVAIAAPTSIAPAAR
jgi:hypothetical protein